MKNRCAILFDLGKVLFDFDHMIAVDRISDYSILDKEKIYNLFFDSNLTDLYERGKISSLEFFAKVKILLKMNIEENKFFQIWNEIFFPKLEMLEILGLLRQHYPLYLISNINEAHFNYLYENFSTYFDFFKHLFLSYKLGLRKPDLLFYQLVIDDIKLSPSDIIYTDDRPELVEAAKKLKIDAFVFESPEKFLNQLRKRKIRINLVTDQKGSYHFF